MPTLPLSLSLSASEVSVLDVSTSLQARWRRGEPVVVGSLDREFELPWGPHGFLERFGAEQVNMIDCRDGKSVHWLTLAHFFAGYTKPWTRAKCPDTFRRMMLKLKDWPPNTDFRDKMPEYFDDLMEALPFPQYTHRDGVLNLARHFPPDCVPPDLGPKMYNGFGQKHAWRGMDPAVAKGGHTNLHCDVSDAVNVMVDVYEGDDGDDSEDETDEARAAPRAWEERLMSPWLLTAGERGVGELGRRRAGQPLLPARRRPGHLPLAGL